MEITDHFPIYNLFKKGDGEDKKSFQSRKINENSIQSFIAKISNTNFNDVFNSNDTNVAFSTFFNKLFKEYNKAFPIKTKKVKINSINAPWITPKLKLCIKKKFKLFNLLKRGLIPKRSFIAYKNILTWVTKKIRQQYYLNKLENDKKDAKKTWSNINTMLSRVTCETVTKLKTEEGADVTGVNMANYFNEYFTNVASQLIINLPNSINYEYLGNIQPIPQTCFFAPTDETEIIDIIKSLPNKGNNLTDIKPSILFSVHQTIAPLISYLYNMSISNSTYPLPLKIARVVPVFKSGTTTKVSNYRPISNLPSINKIFELLTHKRMTNFIEKHNILSNVQFGFRTAQSTTLAILRLTNDLLNTFHHKSFTIAVFLDLRKAFDTVNRDILLHKLSSYGFRGNINMFLRSYLSERTQYVNVNNHNSDTSSISVGVPQGSVLGPLLFNIFIRDITDINIAKKVVFADDTVFYVTENTLEACVHKVNILLTNLATWLENNKLIPNTDKTKLMLFSPRPVDFMPDITLCGTKLEWVTNIKYLGIIIDNKLNFSLHSEEVHKKLCKLQGMMYSLSTLVPRQTLMTIYHSLIYSTITQNIIIWGGIAECNLERIKTTMNKILRIILRVRYDHNNVPLMATNDMYKELRLLQFDDVHRYFLLKFIHTAFYKNHAILQSYFVHLLPNHSYNTRRIKINLPPTRLEIEKYSTIFQSCKLINEIRDDFLKPMSDNTIKTKFLKHTLQTY